MLNTRKIEYIDSDEDVLQKEVDWAVTQTMDQLFAVYCRHIASSCAMAGIDVLNHPSSKNIYYIEEDEQ